MELEEIEELSNNGELELLNSVAIKESNDNELADTPPSGRNEPRFKLTDIDEKFKDFIIRDNLILVVGSCATQGKGADIDLVIEDQDLPDILRDAIRFRLYRQVSGEFDIPYDKVTESLHIHDENLYGSYTSYYPLYRIKIERIPNAEIHQMSLSQNEILEKSKEFVIAGIVSTDSIDLEGEKVTQKALEKMWHHIKSLPEEYRNVQLAHSSTQIGTVLLEYKNRKSTLLKEGLYLICKLRDDIPIAREVINKIKKHELNSFSIKFGIPQPLTRNIKTICDDKKCWDEIKDAYYIEVSLTSAPANEDCLNSVEIITK